MFTNSNQFNPFMLIGLYAYYILGLWIGVCVGGFGLSHLYAYATMRTKIIKVRSVVMSRMIIDEDLNVYNVLSNHILGCDGLQSKIFKMKIGSYYKIKIYGFDSPLTQVNVIELLPEGN